jgi:hypothetical protein
MTALQTARPAGTHAQRAARRPTSPAQAGQAVGALHRVMINTDSDVSIGAVLTVEVPHGYRVNHPGNCPEDEWHDE